MTNPVARIVAYESFNVFTRVTTYTYRTEWAGDPAIFGESLHDDGTMLWHFRPYIVLEGLDWLADPNIIMQMFSPGSILPGAVFSSMGSNRVECGYDIPLGFEVWQVYG